MQFTDENGNAYLEFMNTAFQATRAMFAGSGSDELLDGIYNDLSERWMDLYQERVGKYLAAPQLGIQRESLQQFNASVAAFHRFLGAGSGFIVMFSKPLMRSMDIIQQSLRDEGKLNADSSGGKDFYNLAVKILDKEYDAWLKSPEGVKCVADLVEKYIEYKQSLNPVKDSWLKSISVPTKAEMEDVYKGIYELRKKSRQQETVIREQNDAIKKLTAKIQKLEESLAKAVPKKNMAASRKTKPRTKTKN